jgi:hypothetical protein
MLILWHNPCIDITFTILRSRNNRMPTLLLLKNQNSLSLSGFIKDLFTELAT